MASNEGRTATKPRPRAKQRSTSRRPKSKRYRRAPWYGRPTPWIGIAAVVTVVALAIFLPNRGEERAGGAEPYIGGDFHSLVVDPTTGRLYVGGHGGVAKTDDAGKTWAQIESLNGADAMGWAFTDEAILVGGHPGIFVSTDGGTTFEQQNEGLPATDIHGLGTDGTTVYAASPQVGILASGDQGATWEVRTDRAGHSFMGRILVDPGNPKRLIAPDMRGGAAESTDGGKTWVALGGVPGAMWVSWEESDTDHVIVTGMGIASESTDGGKTWTGLRVPSGVSVVEMDPDDPQTLHAGVLEGETAVVWRSTDGGESWTRI
jgi:photosystem II stability/assembly factor-like uncharacterized protein